MRKIPGILLAQFLLAVAAARPQVPAASATSMATHEHGGPTTYGGSVESKHLVPATAFFPGGSSIGFTGVSSRYATNGSGIYAPLHLPSGAKVVSLELGYYDSNAAAAERASLWVCDFLGNNCVLHPSAGDGPADCNPPGYICSGIANAPGSGYLFSTVIADDDITIDNLNNQYFLEAANDTFDGTTRVASVIVGYVLRVSPPPGTATFNDVPVSHPFFQFVEALARSGITAGCGGGNYCPDAPLTRGQMAVFLAKALGLQWP